MKDKTQKIKDSVKTVYQKGIKKTIKGMSNKLFAEEAYLLVHCCYHKAGTHWFANILRAIAEAYGLTFQLCEQPDLNAQTDIFFQNHSGIDPTLLRPFRGSHMIRDPRDIIISGYFYHLWTDEKWAHIPKAEYGLQSYQKYLNSLDQDDGLLAEIKRTQPNVNNMAQWNYENPNIIELKYEEVITDEAKWFYRMFTHYRFNPAAIDKAMQIAESFSFKNVAKRAVGVKKKKSHLRSGKPGEWRELFTEKHKSYFKELNGDALVQLGYEKNNNW